MGLKVQEIENQVNYINLKNESMYMLLGLLFLYQCSLSAPQAENRKNPVWEPIQNHQLMAKAYFASGCFWCVEYIFESLAGVKEAYSGYAGGKTKNPNYYQITTGRTGHAETVEVIYDSNIISFKTLLEVFFDSHDPTLLNQQGPDRGTQYRSIAFYQNQEEKKIIIDYINKLMEERAFDKKIVTEVKPLEKFYYAEEYHQDYEVNNPNDPYILNISKPRFYKFKAKSSDLLKDGH